MPFLVGGRVSLPFDGIYDGLVCEVGQLDAEPLLYHALGLAAVYSQAEGAAAEVAALRTLYEFIEAAARPVWNIVDQQGPVPPTTSGMLRLRVGLMLHLVDLWTDTFVVPDAVSIKRDEIIKRAKAQRSA